MIVAFVGAVVLYFSSKTSNVSPGKLTPKTTREALRTAARDRLAVFVRTTGSSLDWERLVSQKGALDRLLTVELEREWSGQRPIVFLGSVTDVASLDENNYLVRLRYAPWWVGLWTDLRLDVACPKDKVEPALELLRGSGKPFRGTPGLAVPGRWCPV